MTNIYIKYFVQKMGVKPKTQPLQYIQCAIYQHSENREKYSTAMCYRTIQLLFVMTPISTFENWCCLLQKVCQLLQPSLTFTTLPIIEPRNSTVPRQMFFLLEINISAMCKCSCSTVGLFHTSTYFLFSLQITFSNKPCRCVHIFTITQI